MKQKIKIPATVEEAVSELSGIDALLTAKGWERAAIVAAFVRLGQSGDNRFTVGANTGPYESPKSFAALGIAGLKSKDTVQSYVQRWLEASQGVYPEPGANVTLPLVEYPASKSAAASTNTPAKVVASLTADADKMTDVIKQAADKLGAEALAKAIREASEETANRVEVDATRERALNNYSDRAGGIVDKFERTVKDARDIYDRSDTGHVGPASAVARLQRSLAEVRLWNPNGAPGLVEAMHSLNDFVGAWLAELTTDHTAQWTEADRLLASELGIDLEVSR
jgi:hypothetical protein